jgi:hypothetical protein
MFPYFQLEKWIKDGRLSNILQHNIVNRFHNPSQDVISIVKGRRMPPIVLHYGRLAIHGYSLGAAAHFP